MKPKITKDYYDIVLLPPAPVRDEAIRLSTQLHPFGTKWVLGKQEYLPHISLYHIKIKAKDLSPLLHTIKIIAASSHGGLLAVGSVYNWHSYICWECAAPQWLRMLHARILKETVQYYDREFGQERLWPKGPGMTQERARNLQRYGAPGILRLYEPHVTLASFPDASSAKKALDALGKNQKRIRFSPAHIALCAIGPSHSCQKIVAEFPFKK